MKKHRITLKSSKFSDDFREKERARAMKELEKAESFVLITKIDEHNDCISAIEGDHTKYMAFNCHLASEEIMKTYFEMDGK